MPKDTRIGNIANRKIKKNIYNGPRNFRVSQIVWRSEGQRGAGKMTWPSSIHIRSSGSSRQKVLQKYRLNTNSIILHANLQCGLLVSLLDGIIVGILRDAEDLIKVATHAEQRRVVWKKINELTSSQAGTAQAHKPTLHPGKLVSGKWKAGLVGSSAEINESRLGAR